MPLEGFANKVGRILSGDAVPDKILVTGINVLRHAEAEARYAAAFAAIND